MQYIHETIMHSSISSTSLARLMPREIHADVNAGFTLVECNREIDEHEVKHEVMTTYGNGECVKFIRMKV